MIIPKIFASAEINWGTKGSTVRGLFTHLTKALSLNHGGPQFQQAITQKNDIRVSSLSIGEIIRKSMNWLGTHRTIYERSSAYRRRDGTPGIL